MNRLGIEQLTHMGMPPVELVKLVAELGCVGISSGLTGMPLAAFGFPDFAPYPAWSLADDANLRRETKAALDDTGVKIELAEGFRVRDDMDVSAYASGMDIMAGLGATRVNAVSTDWDLPRTYDQLGKLADMTMERGMEFTIEYAPMNPIASLKDALEAVAQIGGGKAKVLVDAMHTFRSGTTLDDIRALDPALIGYAQLCDAPLVAPEGVSYFIEACTARAVPGEGEFPLREWIAALPADLPMGIEAPRVADMVAGMTPAEHLARVVKAARELGA